MNTEPGSLEVKAKAAVVRAVGSDGPAWMEVSGAVETMSSCSAGSSPAMPYSFTARTWNRYSPSGRFVYVCGDEHGSNRLLKNGFGVIRHSNVAFGSVEVNSNVCSGPGLGSGGVTVIVGSSGGETRRHSCRAGSGSTLPKMSIARTWKTCTPGSSCSSRYGDSQDSNGSASSEHSYSSTGGPLAEHPKQGV